MGDCPEAGVDDGRTDRQNEVQAEGQDVADGPFTKRGRYTPRKCENDDWPRGPTSGTSDEEDDPNYAIFHLIKVTCPHVRWREGVMYILAENVHSEADLRKVLTFLHRNSATGIKAIDEGFGTSVLIEENSAPQCLQLQDWMKVIDGLGFDMTSPGSISNIDYVEVTIGKSTDALALKGFCNILHSLLNMSWTNLQCVARLGEVVGKQLYQAVMSLSNGYGIDASSRPVLEEAETTFPSFMKDLGFQRDDSTNNLQWQQPGADQPEFRRLCQALHGLYRPANIIETLI